MLEKDLWCPCTQYGGDTGEVTGELLSVPTSCSADVVACNPNLLTPVGSLSELPLGNRVFATSIHLLEAARTQGRVLEVVG